jgi:UPF0755 protein
MTSIIKEFYNDLTMASPYNTYINTTSRPNYAGHNGFEAVINLKRMILSIQSSVDSFCYHEFVATLKEQ